MSSLKEAFGKVRPDLLEQELTDERCCKILEELNIKAMSASGKKGRGTDLEGLTQRVKLLQEELTIAYAAGADIVALKAKAVSIMEQFTRERDRASKADERAEAATKKLTVMTTHIEKLMKCLRNEASNKIKVVEAHRRERHITGLSFCLSVFLPPCLFASLSFTH